jgi:NAD(P)-dependent dehydrogenase (short-subunit alcohol dehydrogenase family)
VSAPVTQPGPTNPGSGQKLMADIAPALGQLTDEVLFGQAIARRVGYGKQVLLADAGFDVSTAVVDLASRASVEALRDRAVALGSITGLVQAGGVSPSQAPIETILRVDLYGNAVVLDCFGSVMARGGSLRVMAEAVRWGKRGARINTISPGIVMTPLARDELTGPRGAGYRRMIEVCAVGRAGTADEVGNVAALLMGPDGGFITGSDILMDGGVTAAWRFGDLAPVATS